MSKLFQLLKPHRARGFKFKRKFRFKFPSANALLPARQRLRLNIHVNLNSPFFPSTPSCTAFPALRHLRGAQIRGPGVMDGGKWNSVIKSHQPSLMRYRQGQQIQVCKLAGTVDSLRREDFFNQVSDSRTGT